MIAKWWWAHTGEPGTGHRETPIQWILGMMIGSFKRSFCVPISIHPTRRHYSPAVQGQPSRQPLLLLLHHHRHLFRAMVALWPQKKKWEKAPKPKIDFLRCHWMKKQKKKTVAHRMMLMIITLCWYRLSTCCGNNHLMFSPGIYLHVLHHKKEEDELLLRITIIFFFFFFFRQEFWYCTGAGWGQS